LSELAVRLCTWLIQSPEGAASGMYLVVLRMPIEDVDTLPAFLISPQSVFLISDFQS
jgi:hypothetical protein